MSAGLSSRYLIERPNDRYLSDPNLRPPRLRHAKDIEFLRMANGTTATGAGLSWANQGSRTASVQGGRLIAGIPAAVTDYGGAVVAAPSGDFSVATRLRLWPNEDYHGFGLLAVNDSPLGTFANWRDNIRVLSTSNSFYFSSISNTWAYGGVQHGTTLHSPMHGEAIYLRLRWNDTTDILAADFSAEPASGWTQLATVTHTAQPPTYVGFTMTGENSANFATYGSFDFLRFDWTPDFDPRG